MSAHVSILLILLAVAPCAFAQEKPLFVLVARDGVSLMTILAESFSEEDKSGFIQVEREMHESVFTAIGAKKADLVSLSPGFSMEEEMRFNDVHQAVVRQHVVAFESAALISGGAGQIRQIDMSDLRSLYSADEAERAKWGGQVVRLLALNREHPSLRIVVHRMGVNAKIGSHVEAVMRQDVLLKGVEQDAGAIGLIRWTQSIPASMKYIEVVNEAKVGVVPNEDTIRSGAYPLSMPISLAWRNDSPPAVKRFVEYVIGERGQEVVRKAGYVASRLPIPLAP
jgi:ABC-type phosphate transport system substrate-binding protein